jgi:Zn-dependent membrane protease YugP
VGVASGLTGAEAAQRMLASEGVNNVRIEPVNGFLTDHFDPVSNTLRLSPNVYHSQSLSAIGVACHEAGHALQKAHAYAPLHMRSALVPVTNLTSQLSMPVLFAGFLLSMPALIKLGIILFAAVVVFALITLPVEWDATARAKRVMVRAGIATPQEQPHAGRVLNAAFLTYVASAVTSIGTLLYYLTIANRSRD